MTDKDHVTTVSCGFLNYVFDMGYDRYFLGENDEMSCWLKPMDMMTAKPLTTEELFTEYLKTLEK